MKYSQACELVALVLDDLRLPYDDVCYDRCQFSVIRVLLDAEIVCSFDMHEFRGGRQTIDLVRIRYQEGVSQWMRAKFHETIPIGVQHLKGL